jgi:hypothetical protein
MINLYLEGFVLKKLITFSIIFLCIILYSCNNRVYRSALIIPTPTPFSRNITEKTFQITKLNSLEVNLRNAQVTFTSWGRKEAKVEIELTDSGKSKGNNTQQTKPEDIVLMDCKDDNLILRDAVKSKNNYFSKITIYCPYDVKQLLVQIENGDFSSNGDLNSSSKIKIIKGNINLARYKGTLDAEVQNGNISIASGKLNGASKIYCKSGNIDIKTEILEADIYRFETDTGNIELSLPAKTSSDFSCQGNVMSNAFKSSGNGSRIVVSSKQGVINIKKY